MSDRWYHLANSLEPGDRMILGKRTWEFVGDTHDLGGEYDGTNEMVFHQATPDPGEPVDLRRVMARSEVGDLMSLGARIKRKGEVTP